MSNLESLMVARQLSACAASLYPRRLNWEALRGPFSYGVLERGRVAAIALVHISYVQNICSKMLQNLTFIL